MFLAESRTFIHCELPLEVTAATVASGGFLFGEQMTEYEQKVKNDQVMSKKLFADLLYKQKGNCYICGIEQWRIKKTLHAHRIIPGKLGGKYNTTNAILVCPKCHSKIEGLSMPQIEQLKSMVSRINESR